MTYTALYRKFRPLVFDDVSGQDAITQTLKRQVAAGRVSHAYLFMGTRGTGKTTCAKILARAVNCENPKNGDPCNVCPSCKSVLSGASTDVAEIDAASNNGVDDVRALREEFAYTPAELKKRVYIIDEVHMLSNSAFNALLKSLEEPPEHVLFILATTEAHKIPATIISRCQRFSFKRISAEIIRERLLYVAKEEKIDLLPEAALLIAQTADGALRDGLSMLDRCTALSEGFPVDVAAVREALGLSGTMLIADWAEQIAKRDCASSLKTLNDLYQSGKEYPVLLDELAVFFRDILQAVMLGGQSSPRIDAETLNRMTTVFDKERLIFMITALQKCQSLLPKSFNSRIDCELCVMELCGTVAASSSPAVTTRAPVSVNITATAPAPVIKNEPASAPVNVPAPTAEPVIAEKQQNCADLFGDASALYKPYLSGAKAEVTPSGVKITVFDKFAEMNLKQPDFQKYLQTRFPGTHSIIYDNTPPKINERLDALLKNNTDIIEI